MAQKKKAGKLSLTDEELRKVLVAVASIQDGLGTDLVMADINIAKTWKNSGRRPHYDVKFVIRKRRRVKPKPKADEQC